MGLESFGKKKPVNVGLHKALQAALLGGAILTAPTPAAYETSRAVYATEDSSTDGASDAGKGTRLSENVEDHRSDPRIDMEDPAGDIVPQVRQPTPIDPSMARDIDHMVAQEKLKEAAEDDAIRKTYADSSESLVRRHARHPDIPKRDSPHKKHRSN